MITTISHITMFVQDQDESLKFYTEKVGFKVHTDAMFGDMRWLTLHPAGNPNFELILMLAETEIEKALVGNQGGDKPFFNVTSTDCKKDYDTMKALGVEFHAEPETQPWGIATSFEDPSGNIMYMSQESK
jgi:catechol 2,3-dioxygenase-like lactoylglutathione lyase family enzyme